MEINPAKKAFLFLNTSGYKLAIDLTNANNNTITNKRSLGIACNMGLELCLVHLSGIGGAKNSSWVIVAFIFSIAFHLTIDLIFSQEIDVMAHDYNLYYKRSWYIAYWVLIIAAIIYGVCILFSNI
jgi:hypothetical protein